MAPDELAMVTALDTYLDALTDDALPHATTADLEPALVAVVKRIHTAAITIAPDPTFSRTLRSSFTTPSTEAGQPSRHSTVLGITASRPNQTWQRRIWWPRLEFAAMLAIFAVALVLIAGRGGGNHSGTTGNQSSSNHPNVTGAATPFSQATDDPDARFAPENCTVQAPSDADAQAIVDAVNRNRKPTATARPTDSVVGSIAGETTANEIDEAVVTWLACVNTNDFWRVIPLYSRDYLNDAFSPGPSFQWFQWIPDLPSVVGTPIPDSPDTQFKLLAILRVNIVSDNTVVVDIINQISRDGLPSTVLTRLYFVRSSDQWLIDSIQTPWPTSPQSKPNIGDAVTISTATALYELPSSSSPAVSILLANTALIAISPPVAIDDTIWSRVRTIDSMQQGWIIIDNASTPTTATPDSFQVPTPTSTSARTLLGLFTEGKTIVTTSDVRMRSEPSTDANIVEELDAGDELVVLDSTPVEEGGYVWWNVRDEASGTVGWIVEDWLGSTGISSIPTEKPNTDLYLIGDSVQTTGQTTIYEEPRSSSTVIQTIPASTHLVLTGPASWDGTARWWPVSVPQTDVIGYVMESWLRSADDVSLTVIPTVTARPEILIPSPPSARTPANPPSTPTPERQITLVDPNMRIEQMVTLDVDGIVANGAQARTAAIATLREAFAPYRSCTAAFVQTFGYSDDLSEGIVFADTVNGLLPNTWPDLFQNAIFESYANVGQGRGSIEFRVYVYEGCEMQGTAVPHTDGVVGSPPATVSAPAMPTIGASDT